MARRAARASGQAAAIFGRRLPRQLAKGSRERAGLAEPDIERDLGHRARRHRQQRLRLFDASVGVIAVRRDAEGLLEGAGKMERAQASEVGQGGERYRLREGLVDVLSDDPSLPAGEAAPEWRLWRWLSPTPGNHVGDHDGAQPLRRV